jgi:hypothetical protein
VRRLRETAGFLAAEGLIALAVAVIVIVSIARFVTVGRDANRRAAAITFATLAAEEKAEQLRGLAWGIGADGSAISDPALAPSPVDSLDRDVGGFCDFLDAHAGFIASGSSRPPTAFFTRRWNVAPLATAPDRAIVVQVAVLAEEHSAPIVRIAGIRGRKSP